MTLSNAFHPLSELNKNDIKSTYKNPFSLVSFNRTKMEKKSLFTEEIVYKIFRK